MNLLQQLETAFASEFTLAVEPRKNKVKHKPWESKQSKADVKYRDLLTGKQMTTGEIARTFGYSPMGCLTSLYRLEQRGKIKRVGTAPRVNGYKNIPGRGSIIWTWCED